MPWDLPRTRPPLLPSHYRREPLWRRLSTTASHPKRTCDGSVAKFDFGAKSQNWVSGIQWLTDANTLEKATLRQNPKILADHHGQALVIFDHQDAFGHLPHLSGNAQPTPLPEG